MGYAFWDGDTASHVSDWNEARPSVGSLSVPIPRKTIHHRIRTLLTTLLLLLVASSASAGGVDINDTVNISRRFGEQTCPTCIGDTWTEVFPGERFMYNVQSAFECGSCTGYTTTMIVEFPDSVVPQLPSIYPEEYLRVVGNTVELHHSDYAGVGINIPFDVKDEGDLPPGATDILLKTHITVVTPSDGTLENMVEDTIDIVRANAFTASAAASPNEVQLSDANAVITVTATLTNVGGQDLSNVAPTADPAPSIADAVEKTAGPTPASVNLASGASGSITYTYKPKKAGTLTFGFADFTAQGSSGTVHGGSATTNTVAIKDDVTVDVTVTPMSLQTDSSTASVANIVIKAKNPKGEPVEGQSVALDFPQYFGIVDLDPRVMICKPDGTLVFPPGASPTLLDVDYATTSSSGEATYQLQLGTQRRTTQLLVTGTAIDENKIDLDQDGVQVDLPLSGAAPNPSSHVDLNALQLADLPPAQQTAAGASVVGTGAPFEVLRALVAWMETKREAGGLLRSFDWVPISSPDDQYAGVLLYDRAQLDAVRAHFDGGGPLPGAYVLQIEKVALSFSTYEVKWERPWISLDTWENTPLDDQGLPIPNSNDIPRLRAKPVIELVTGSPYAFLGYPYPAVSSDGYGAGCVPHLNGVSVQVHSPVTLLVKDAQGRALGFDASGAYVSEIPGGAFSSGEPATYALPPGSYQTEIVGTGKGRATIVLSAGGAAPKTFALKVKPGKTGTLSFDDTLAGPTGTFNKRKLKVIDGVPITVTGVKKKIKVHSGDPLTLTVTNAFGAPVAGARVHASGTGFEAETLTGADGVGSLALMVTKETKRLVVTVAGAGVQAKTLKVKVKLAK